MMGFVGTGNAIGLDTGASAFSTVDGTLYTVPANRFFIFSVATTGGGGISVSAGQRVFNSDGIGGVIRMGGPYYAGPGTVITVSGNSGGSSVSVAGVLFKNT